MGQKATGMGKVMDRNQKITQFLTQIGWADAQRTRVAGDASNRTYDRLVRNGTEPAILMDAPSDTSGHLRPFIMLADHLRAHGLSTPQIYHKDEAAGLLLIEDFGDALFADLMAADAAQEGPLYRASADVLLHLRDVPPPDLSACDAQWLVKMLAPLFEWYIPEPNKAQLDKFTHVFLPLAEQVAATDKIIMLRDYHVLNLLLLTDREGVQRVGILDFQDAMLAHPAYDLVSILQDARRDVSPQMEQEIITYYLSQAQQDETGFLRDYALLGLQRNLRILGIFARLCLRDGKASYVDFMPRVWGYVLRNLTHPALAPLSEPLLAILAEPTPSLLEDFKRRCPPPSQP